jgi:hypothetical protein
MLKSLPSNDWLLFERKVPDAHSNYPACRTSTGSRPGPVLRSQASLRVPVVAVWARCDQIVIAEGVWPRAHCCRAAGCKETCA